MGAPAVIPGVFAQFQKLFDVQVPGLEVGADRALALAALVDGYRGVVDHLQEWHNALGFAVGSLDMGAQRPNPAPVVTQAARELRQQRVFLDGLIDAIEIIGHGREVATRELRAQGAAVEEGGRA